VAAGERLQFPQDRGVHRQDQIGPVQQAGGDLDAAVGAQVVAETVGGGDHRGMRGAAEILVA